MDLNTDCRNLFSTIKYIGILNPNKLSFTKKKSQVILPKQMFSEPSAFLYLFFEIGKIEHIPIINSIYQNFKNKGINVLQVRYFERRNVQISELRNIFDLFQFLLSFINHQMIVILSKSLRFTDCNFLKFYVLKKKEIMYLQKFKLAVI